MQAQQAIEACKAIYKSGLPAQTKLESIGTFLGVVGVVATKPAVRNATTARTSRTTARPNTAQATRTRTRAAAATTRNRTQTTAAATPAATLAFDNQVYAQTASTSGTPRADIKIRGANQQKINGSLSRLKKAGRLVEQNGVWFREMPQSQAA